MTDPSPTALIVETTADEECPLEFLGDSADIVYFISFAHSERYGAGHPLAKAAGLLNVIEGEGADVLATLTGPYDLIHDDGWFAREPVYFDRMLGLLRPGGLLLISNFFLLEQAVTGRTTMDWSEFAGPDWAEQVKSYARKLVAHPALHVSFLMSPSWVALAVKLS